MRALQQNADEFRAVFLHETVALQVKISAGRMLNGSGVNHWNVEEARAELGQL